MTGGLNQNAPVPVTLHDGWLESERARYSTSANEWCDPYVPVTLHSNRCIRYVASWVV